MRYKRWSAVAATLVVVASGCSPAPTPSVSPQISSNATLVTNQQDPANLRDGGQFRLPISTLPRQWNPLHADATADALLVLDPVRPRAFRYDAGGTSSPDPDYVTSASATHDVATVATLRLNPASVWGDGTPITAADWVATWKALSGTHRGAKVAAAGWSRIASVRAGAGDHEVIVTYRGVEPDWTKPLEHAPVRAAGVADAQTFNNGWTTFRPEWFAGPYLVAHVDRMQGVVTLERNPRWWGAEPRLESIVFRTIQPQAEAAAFASNEFDLYNVVKPESGLPMVREAEGVSIRSGAGTTGRVLTFDAEAGPLRRPAVRRAVVRAVDRERLASALMDDAGGEALPWSNHLLLTNQPGYTDQADATGLTYDPAAAADLLTQDGWRLSGGQRVKDGRPLQLTIGVDPDEARTITEATRIASDLAAVGISARQVNGAGDLEVTTMRASRYPLAAVGSTLTRTPSLKDLAERIQSEPDPVARTGLATQAARQLWEQGDTLPLYQEPQVVATKADLANVGADAFASTRWTDIGWTR